MAPTASAAGVVPAHITPSASAVAQSVRCSTTNRIVPVSTGLPQACGFITYGGQRPGGRR
jgi:hypothetical protein